MTLSFFYFTKSHGFPASRSLFSFCVRWADEYEKRAWVETHFNPTAVNDLGRGHSSNRMLHDLFVECDKSLLCLANYFTVIPLFVK